MNRSNPTPLAPLDEDLNRTLRHLARERELVEARRRIEEEILVEEGVDSKEEESEAEMAANQPAQGAAVEEQRRTMGYYMDPRPTNIQLAIRHPPVAANNFEIKHTLVTMIQNSALFHGLSNESLMEHVQHFIVLAWSLKINGVP
ncbi:unnamed protein product [Linum trigynum]|uniref:Uncharacterized protein n=1 Tax=Linum trigynum TaxID=586398 RepID=A0AAV2E864_9ROSI